MNYKHFFFFRWSNSSSINCLFCDLVFCDLLLNGKNTFFRCFLVALSSLLLITSLQVSIVNHHFKTTSSRVNFEKKAVKMKLKMIFVMICRIVAVFFINSEQTLEKGTMRKLCVSGHCICVPIFTFFTSISTKKKYIKRFALITC